MYSTQEPIAPQSQNQSPPPGSPPPTHEQQEPEDDEEEELAEGMYNSYTASFKPNEMILVKKCPTHRNEYIA